MNNRARVLQMQALQDMASMRASIATGQQNALMEQALRYQAAAADRATAAMLQYEAAKKQGR